ncbi:MAG TPA: hypothetical protein VFC77_08360, partial [Myxococcota bacterium]|nr:hypothetical protein [Myxococcota bacterium]
MAATDAALLQELKAYTPADPVLSDVLERAWTAIVGGEGDARLPELDELGELHLAVVNPSVASPALKASPWFTESCQARRAERLIVVNEEFLLDLESAVRSFGQSESLAGTPYLKSDGQLFVLTRRIRDDRSWLRRLRRRGADPAEAATEERTRRELALVLLFFLGHELGHVLAGHESGQFAAFVRADAPLEQRVEEAVVRLCRHVDEFAPTQFGLPGFEKVAKPGSDVRREAERMRAQDPRRHERHDAFFAREAEADGWANRVAIRHLESLAAKDAVDAELALHLLARGVFVAALWTWYRDLDAFAAKLGIGPIGTANDLSAAMMRGRETYVHAASLFGDVHRFTLLRAALALEAILRARSTWFERPRDDRSIHCTHDDAKRAADPSARREWWLS